MKKLILLLSLIMIYASCTEETEIPKPKAQLRLNYPKAVYKPVHLKYFSFDKSNQAQLQQISDRKINLIYPKMKAEIYLTYNPVRHNLKALLSDAEKFTYEHTVKADEIITRDFVNEKAKVYATINKVTGNAASQIQFHATDSVTNFLDGSLYFYAQPNYDSIMPAVKYLEKDIHHLIENLKWH